VVREGIRLTFVGLVVGHSHGVEEEALDFVQVEEPAAISVANLEGGRDLLGLSSSKKVDNSLQELSQVEHTVAYEGQGGPEAYRQHR
jgi:hypothetical protein